MKPKEIQKLRKKMGKTQKEFAEIIGCSRACVVGWWETGKGGKIVQPKGLYLKKLQELQKIIM